MAFQKNFTCVVCNAGIVFNGDEWPRVRAAANRKGGRLVCSPRCLHKAVDDVLFVRRDVSRREEMSPAVRGCGGVLRGVVR